ncbi:MAG: nuclear transport factor 2 family protein [Alcanivoracaceae bacterium]
MRSPIQVMMDNLNRLENEQALEEMVFELYAPEATFEDPIQKVRGRKAIVGMYQDMVKIFPELTAVLKREVRNEQIHVAEWDMTFKSRYWPKAITLSGTSWLELDNKGMILSHKDYWDLWQFVRRAVALPEALLERLPEPLRHLLN